MSIIESGRQSFEPYARLMNIIGDQLITDKIVAVIEIVKNSYDADADNVEVRFFNFHNFNNLKLPEAELPYIEIWDDGDGMNLETIKEVWLRPATPNKLKRKYNSNKRTKKGRIIQGEKGIGRFAIHKIGEKIELFTKTSKSKEVNLSLDFTEFDPEKVDLFNQPVEDYNKKEYKLLNQIENEWKVNDPALEIVGKKGTLIRISNLRETWKEETTSSISDIDRVYAAIQKLIPPVDPNASKFNLNITIDFDVKVFKDGIEYVNTSNITFDDIFARAQFKMFGTVDNEYNLYFTYQSSITKRQFDRNINLLNPFPEYDLISIRRFWRENELKESHLRVPKCGGFSFSFYAFDLFKKDRTIITKDVEEFVKNNSVYLFRDGVRVYPFGEKQFDWLDLDKLRSVYRAGAFLSYNDLNGFVYITQHDNPSLKDASSRQGIMDIDGAYEDFRNLMLGCVQIMTLESKKDKSQIKAKETKLIKETANSLQHAFDSFKKDLEKIEHPETLEKATLLMKTVNTHVALMRQRVDTYEGLAGLGMAVEKSSHDALMILSSMRKNIRDYKHKLNKGNGDTKEFLSLLNILDENISFVYDEMQIIQPLFKMQRKSAVDVDIKESIEKVLKYFRRDIDRKIDVQIEVNTPLIIHVNSGFILQILINILDNAIYWLSLDKKNINKKIHILIDGRKRQLIIADNGKGIDLELSNLIFHEFFSQKADGRGLGLFIVKEILQRMDADIEVIKEERSKILSGANFLVTF